MNYIFSEEHKLNISKSMKGNTNSKGRVLTDEHKNNIGKANSISLKGKRCSPKSEFKKDDIPWNKEKPMADETKDKLRIINLGNHYKKGKTGQKAWNEGIPMPEETKNKISASKIGKPLSESTRLAMKGRIPWNKGIPFMEGDTHPNWKGGISFEPYCQKFNIKLKERIRERDNRTCQLCGEKENGKKLACHHVHYDKPNCNPDLISLCNRCNIKANYKRDYYEELFMKKLEERGLLCNQKNVKNSQSN